MKKKPKFEHGCPVWWNQNAKNVGVSSYVPNGSNLNLNIDGNTHVSIERKQGIPGTFYFDVTWETKSMIDSHSDYQIHGKIFLTKSEFEGAFGLIDDYQDKDSRWLTQRYGADSVSQGKFIRYQSFLNIPSPGTGKLGDPNASILITEEIRSHAVNMVNF